MGHEKYRRRLAHWLGGLVVFILLFPFFVYALVTLTCHPGTGACGALAAVVGMTIKPLGIAVILVGLTVIAWKRMRAAGLGVPWFIAIVLWSIASVSFLVGFGNFWGANFGMGLLFGGFPIIILFLLAFLMLLATNFDSAPIRVEMTGAAWKVAAGAAALGLLLSVHQIVMGIRLLPYVGWWTADLFFSVIRAMPPAARDLVFGMPGRIILWADLAIFIAALFAISRGSSFDADACADVGAPN